MLSVVNHIGLNITKSKLQLVEVVRESSKFCLENVDEHIFDKEMDFSNQSEIISILQTTLNSITNITTLKSSNISVSLPIQEFLLFQIPFEPSLSSKALDEHLAWEFSIIFPELNVDDFVIRKLELKNHENKRELIVVALRMELIETIDEFCKINNFTLKFIDNSHFSSDLTLILNENKTTLSIYVDYDFASIISYSGKRINKTHRLNITNDVSLSESFLDFIESQNIAYDKIYVSCPMEVDELKIKLESAFGKNIEITNPFEFIPTSESFIQNAHFINKPNSFSAAAGICFRKF